MGGLKRAFERLKGEEPDADLRFDEAEVGIHKLLLPTDGEPAGLVQFPVIERDGAASSLGRRSHILRTTPRWFRVVRVYADERATDRAARAELARKYQQYAASTLHSEDCPMSLLLTGTWEHALLAVTVKAAAEAGADG